MSEDSPVEEDLVTAQRSSRRSFLRAVGVTALAVVGAGVFTRSAFASGNCCYDACKCGAGSCPSGECQCYCDCTGTGTGSYCTTDSGHCISSSCIQCPC